MSKLNNIILAKTIVGFNSAEGSMKTDSIAFIEDTKEVYFKDKYYAAIPPGGYRGQFLTWESDGKAKWADLDIINLNAYGVEWDTTVSDPNLTRIGNQLLHKQLPIQSRMRGCVNLGTLVQYYLNPDDWRYKEINETTSVTFSNTNEAYTVTGADIGVKVHIWQYLDIEGSLFQVTNITDTSATLKAIDEVSLEGGSYDAIIGSNLSGYDGEVTVDVPEFYYRGFNNGTKRLFYLSTQKIDATWSYLPRCLVDAYRSTVLREVPENMGYLSTLQVNSAISVVNTEAYCRGGNNNTLFDLYLDTDPCRSLLGKPATNISRSTMRADYRLSGKEMLSYEEYKNIFYWLYVVEYANFNVQSTYNEELTTDGYHQGGLDLGLTTINSNYWNYYNNQYAITPCGYCNDLGNHTGTKALKILLPTTSGAEPTFLYTASIPRWRGFDNPFGDIWTNVDGVIIDTPRAGASDSSILPTCYIVPNPSNYTDSLNDIETKATRSIKLPHSESPIKEIANGQYGDIAPVAIGGTESTYHCDRYYINYDDTPETLCFGSSASLWGDAGLSAFFAGLGVGLSWSPLGFRGIRSLGLAETGVEDEWAYIN